MKFKVTKKAVMNQFLHVISAPYCSLDYLLKRKSAIAYTQGVYGWCSDVYDMGNGVAISTGYCPFGNIKVDYAIIDKYNELAKEATCESLEVLINQFVAEVLESNKKK